MHRSCGEGENYAEAPAIESVRDPTGNRHPLAAPEILGIVVFCLMTLHVGFDGVALSTQSLNL
jgi:hypothetical protein